MDGAQIRDLEQADDVSLAHLLVGHHGGALETEIGLEVLSDPADETLEGQLADKRLGTLLVATDLAQSDGAGDAVGSLLRAALDFCGTGLVRL